MHAPCGCTQTETSYCKGTTDLWSRSLWRNSIFSIGTQTYRRLLEYYQSCNWVILQESCACPLFLFFFPSIFFFLGGRIVKYLQHHCYTPAETLIMLKMISICLAVITILLYSTLSNLQFLLAMNPSKQGKNQISYVASLLIKILFLPDANLL